MSKVSNPVAQGVKTVNDILPKEQTRRQGAVSQTPEHRSGGAKNRSQSQIPVGDYDRTMHRSYKQSVKQQAATGDRYDLARIDEELDKLERNKPGNSGHPDDRDNVIDQLSELNHKLRSRIGELEEIVQNAIEKAKEKKKPIITHRDEKNDPDTQEQDKQLKQ